MYWCNVIWLTACISFGLISGEKSVKSVTSPLKASIEPLIQMVDLGRAAQFTCRFEGNPINITWFKDGRDMKHHDAVLRIDSVQLEDIGIYECFIRNDQESAEARAKLKIWGIFEPPQIRHSFAEQTLNPGTAVLLKCTASGNPEPEISWEHDGRRLENGEILDVATVDGKVESHLNISSIHTNDGGLYRCIATNMVGSASHSARVNVYGLPFVRTIDKHMIAAGENLIVHCPFAGYPIDSIVWERDNRVLPIKHNQKVFPNGTLVIENVDRKSDQATYICVVKNNQGNSARGSLEVQVMEVPEVVYDLEVLDKSGRSVQLSWDAHHDSNFPIKEYLIEYKIAKGTWENDIELVSVPANTTETEVFSLYPATVYHLRIVAVNEFGKSKPSNVVTIITADEAPSSAPTELKVEAMDQHSLKVTWKPPPPQDCNGNIKGYYVGYKSGSRDTYIFEVVVSKISKETGKHHLLITNLQTYTEYSVVVQAFNKIGQGPLSEEVKTYTAEGVPTAPPRDATCKTLTAQTIKISWVSPSLSSANGIIKGYKIIYGPSETWDDEETKATKKASGNKTVLRGLKKYTNYSITVMATTGGGDGVGSRPIHCQTEEDLPEAPPAVKALTMGTDSVLVLWRAPMRPNGIITHYTVYTQEQGSEPVSTEVPATQMNYSATELKQTRYDFWVQASTIIGEGQPSPTVSTSPSTKVPAKIATFDDSLTARFNNDVKLPCLAVGVPPPTITWKVKGRPLETSHRVHQLPEGSLLITGVAREDAGNYECHVENSFGSDTITLKLTVDAPPTISLDSSSMSSLTLRFNSTKDTPIHGYTLHYKAEFGDFWETVQIPRQTTTYTLENLYCGSSYQVYVTVNTNSAKSATGEASNLLNARTLGTEPIAPLTDDFIEVTSESVTLDLKQWQDGGCPISYFVVEKMQDYYGSRWELISNRVIPGGKFVVLDLDAGTRYLLRITAHNKVGSKIAEYKFETQDD